MTWHEQGCLCISVPFTWLLKEARAIGLSHPNERVVFGGPAVMLMPDVVADAGEVNTIKPDNPIIRANPNASRSTWGCPNNCEFCGVRRIEGHFREIRDFIPAPDMSDSNFLASSKKHFDYVIGTLKQANLPYVDFHQALDARLLTKYHARRLAELPIRPRFAWDDINNESDLFRALELIISVGIPKSRIAPVLCLVGFKDTPEDAFYRMETLKQRGFLGYPMRYQPLNALKRNAFKPPHWDIQLLADFQRYWARQSWWKDITFQDYRATFKHYSSFKQAPLNQTTFNF